MWGVMSSMVMGALKTITLKLGDGLQQVPGTTSENSVEKNTIPGTAKILCCFVPFLVYMLLILDEQNIGRNTGERVKKADPDLAIH